MKKIVLTVIIAITTITFYGQDFAPIGAKWYYTEQFAFSGDISYLWIESVGDTIIKDKDCKILENNGGLMCAFHNTKDFVYFEDSIAYFYVPETDTFQILYDLKAQKDSSWTVVFGVDIESKLDTIQVVVDSVSYVTYNSKELKKLHVSYKSVNYGWEDLGYGGEIIERIGDKNYLFNLYSLSGIVCDGNYSGGLRCYEDSELGFYSTGIADSCDYVYIWTGIDNVKSSNQIELFPNPAQDYVEIKAKDYSSYTIELFDFNGRLLKSDNAVDSNFQLDLSSVAKGIYMILLQNDNQIIGYKKLIKE